jgi:hypothetical protein
VEPGGFRTEFASKVQWASRTDDPLSPYHGFTAAFRHFKDRIAGRKPGPERVVRTVLRLAQMKRMPLRVRCGTDAKLMYFVRKLLPQGLVDWLASRFYRRQLFS